MFILPINGLSCLEKDYYLSTMCYVEAALDSVVVSTFACLHSSERLRVQISCRGHSMYVTPVHKPRRRGFSPGTAGFPHLSLYSQKSPQV